MSIIVATSIIQGYCRYMNNTTSQTIEVPITDTTDRTWVRTNLRGEQVAVIINPHYTPSTITVDDIDLPGLS